MAKTSLDGRKKYLLMLGDIIILYFSLWTTLILRYQSDFSGVVWSKHLWPFTFVFATWLIIFYIDDLYELNYIQGKTSLLVRLVRDILIGGLFAITFFYLGQDRLFDIKPQTVLMINVAIAGVLIYAWHIIFDIFTKSSKRANGLIIVGFNSLAEEVIKQTKQKPQLGFQVKVIMSSSDNPNIPEGLKPLIVDNDFQDLKSICVREKANTVISTIHPRENAALSKSLFECLPLKINFFDAATFYEKIMGKIPVNVIEQVWFLENLSESNKRLFESLKRVFDIWMSLLLLGLTLPFLPLIMLIIKLDSKGPIFFTQIRTGKQGKNFRAIKFRTMVTDAESNGPQWAVKNDNRVTKIGRFLRKTRIDEIPQLINVIASEMSLIGPRPERPEFVQELEKEIPFYKERLLVKPGLTGWAQVMGPAYGGSKEESLEKLQYDLFYIKNRSLALDLSILLKTIRTVLSTKGQ